MGKAKCMKWCIDCWATGKVDWIAYTRGQRRPMPQKFDHLFRTTDRVREIQIKIIESIKSEICLDTDVECPTCNGKGYIGYLDWDSSKQYIQSEDYLDQLGFRLTVENGKLILSEKIDFSFENFINWLSTRTQQSKIISSLAGRTTFLATLIFKGDKFLKIDYGQKGNSGFVPLDQIKIIWQRYISLGDRKHVTGEYTATNFRDSPNRILAPYVAAIIREFENDINPSFYS
jgi:hypothetical protein